VSEPRPGTTTYVGLSLVSAATISLELVWMRLFSISIWHHFAYMVIAVAMLGFGAAGALPYLWPAIRTLPTERVLGTSSKLFALLTVISLLVLSRVTVDFYDLLRGGVGVNALLKSLMACYVLQFAGFFCAGLYVMSTIARYPRSVNRLYCADLLGAALGVLLAVGGLRLLAGPSLALVIALLALVAGTLVSRRSGSALAGSVAFGLAVLIIIIFLPPKFRVSPGKTPGRYPDGYENRIEFSRWNSLGRVDVLTEETAYLPGTYSLLMRDRGVPMTPYKLVYYDGFAMSPLFRSDGNIRNLAFIPYTLHSLAYTLLEKPRVLVVGVGGGVDALVARYYAADRVTGVELNPIMVDLVTRHYAGYTGRSLLTGDVSILCCEGRNFVAREGKRRYELVQLTGVDTITALSSGAYALSENFLFTAEAFGDYARCLSDNGLLSIVRVRFERPRETLRLVTTAMEAHRRGWFPDPVTNLVIVDGQDRENLYAACLFKQSPYTPEEVERLRAACEFPGFRLAYDPFGNYDNEFRDCLHAPDPARFLHDYWYDVRPVDDNRPYFFQYYKWRNLAAWRPFIHGFDPSMPLQLWITAALVAQVLVLGAVFVVLPLYRYQRAVAPYLKIRILGYFTSLGVGFMLFEIVAMQKLSLYLSCPIWAIAVVLLALLSFSALGSAIGLKALRRGKLVLWLVGLLVLGLAGFGLLHESILGRTLGCGLGWRVAAAVLLIGALGVPMGMLFPAGIRIVDRRAPGLVPIAWGANACASTLGSVLAVLISVTAGYRVAILIGAAVYAAAGILLRSLAGSGIGAEPARELVRSPARPCGRRRR